MYLWKDKQRQSVASCKYAPAGDIIDHDAEAGGKVMLNENDVEIVGLPAGG